MKEEMTNLLREAKEIRLSKILDTMDVPGFRKTDITWLSRNLGINNRDHKDFDEAMRLVHDLYALTFKKDYLLD
jgi:hypothetical protein